MAALSNRWRARLSQYMAELRLCVMMGADMHSRLRLALDTCLFHVSNGLRARPGRYGNPHSYRVAIGPQVVDLRLRPWGGDIFVFHEVFLSECYRLPPAWRRNTRTVVDLGANIGLATLYFSRFFARARYVCVEPHPANAAVLRKNLAHLGASATVIEGAVSDQQGQHLFNTEQHSWGGRLDGEATNGMPVHCYSIEEVLETVGDTPIDLLKIDIEGAEEQLFAGPCQWLDRVSIIIIELHSAAATVSFERAMREARFQVVKPGPEHGTQMLVALHPGHSSTS